MHPTSVRHEKRGVSSKWFFETLSTDPLPPPSPWHAGKQLLVSPRPKPDIGPVTANTGLLSRLENFLEEAKANNREAGVVEKLELEEDCDLAHIELDMACGVFELKDEDAVRAAESAVGGRDAARPSSWVSERPNQRQATRQSDDQRHRQGDGEVRRLVEEVDVE
jgi:hypothetical protein